MGRITEYVVVSAIESEALVEAVNERLRQGWTPLGGPFGDVGRIHQAMIRREQEPCQERLRRHSDDECW